jgi:hypothetical protein
VKWLACGLVLLRTEEPSEVVGPAADSSGYWLTVCNTMLTEQVS